MMKASQCSFDTVFSIAKKNEDLALVLSFVQVEFGLIELQGNWEGWVGANDYYEQTFENECDVANNFGVSLVDLYDLFSVAECMS
jgi:hypothetical protein